MIQPGDCLSGLPDLDLDKEVLERFLYRNAERAFGISIG